MKPGDIVWVVIWEDYDESRLLGVFASAADADAFIDQLAKHRTTAWDSALADGLSSATFYPMPVESLAQAAARIEPRSEGYRGEVYHYSILKPPPEVE